MTLAGYVLLPLCVLLILLPWRFSLTALLPMAIFADAAVFNVGTFGLQPGYLLTLLVVARTLAELLLLRVPLNAEILWELTPLLVFTAVSFIALWIGLAFFQGRVMVLFSSAGFDLALAQPYSLNRQSFTQVFYLALNTALVYCVAHQMCRLTWTSATTIVMRSFHLSACLATVFIIWEQLAFYLGFEFPHTFFHSNAGYIPAYGQTFGDILRPSGSFTEPASLAYFFAGILFFSWQRYRDFFSIGSVLQLLSSTVILLMSTSSTAYVIFALFVAFVIKDLLLALVKAALGQPIQLRREHTFAAGAVAVACVGLAFYMNAMGDVVHEIARQTIFEKSATSSFEQRTGADLMAIDIAIQTGGIGLGLGAHRANTLFTTLVASSGVIGTTAFLVFVLSACRSRPGFPDVLATHFREARAFALGLLLAHAISVPNLNSLLLFCAFGFCVGMKSSAGTAVGLMPSARSDQRPWSSARRVWSAQGTRPATPMIG